MNFADILRSERCKSITSCRSRPELSNEYLLAKIGVDTAENEPLKVWRKVQFIIHSLPCDDRAAEAPVQEPLAAGARVQLEELPREHRPHVPARRAAGENLKLKGSITNLTLIFQSNDQTL